MNSDALHAEVVRQYMDHVNPYLAKLMNFAGFGVEIKGEGCYLYDHDGRRYLDCLGSYGVFALGHRHPRVIQAVKAQLDDLPISGKVFFGRRQAELAEKLASVAPEGLQYTFFSNSGAEAVEAALKFAKITTGRHEFVSTDGGYHGKTMGALSVTGREKYRKPFEPLVPGASFVPFGDTDAIVAAIKDSTAAVIIEAIQGEGGIHIAPPGYLRAIREACDQKGALLIMDEVQTGVGRTGAMFASLTEDIRPDIMTLAKALGGGVMPIGATMGTAHVWEKTFSKNPLMHTSTFGGNPLACAAGLATLQVIEEESLCDRALRMGERFMDGLGELLTHDLVSAVRGRGLMIGVEFAMDEVGELVIAQLTKRGMIAAYTLNNPRVIRIEPPLIITEPEVDFAIKTFGAAVEETAEILATLV